MAKAKKLPSGNWRCQVFDHVDVNGKRHYKSFTASTKREAEFLAAEWLSGRSNELPEDITLYEAITRYIDMKRDVLSPSTVLGYEAMQKNYFQGIGLMRMQALDNTKIQVWISDMAKKLSPKTVRNAHGLLSSTIDVFAPEFQLKTTLPAKKKPELYTPSDDDIKKLLQHISGTELEIAVLLAAFGPMRRGEICALTADDVHGNIVNVNKSMVLGPDGLWSIKQPKTYGSYRSIQYPDFVINRMEGIDGRIIKATPNQISNRFKRAVVYSHLPHFRFHDLRHYAASIMHAIGVPDQYILQRGGWSSDNVMKTVYRNVIDLEAAKQNKKIMQHFEVMQHEMQHEG